MSETTSDGIWPFLCRFRPFVVLGWSISLLFLGISVVLLLTDATEQDAILVVNVFMLTPIVLMSGVILWKCQDW